MSVRTEEQIKRIDDAKKSEIKAMLDYVEINVNHADDLGTPDLANAPIHISIGEKTLELPMDDDTYDAITTMLKSLA